MTFFQFPAPPRSASEERLRDELRSFIATEIADIPAHQRAATWSGYSQALSRKMGARGWIGMTWPKRYGGHERTAMERYVVLEEMLAAGAPVGAHWIADRQSGPLLLRFGTERQRESILPKIAAGELYCCIGMSEPDSGSDLAAVRTRAERMPGGYRVNGTKLWTTYGNHAHYMLLFCRTSAADDRHGGTSQLLVDLTLPGITIRPIEDLSGERHFNEVFFEDVFVPEDALIGTEGNGWKQVTSELAFERSGPERFLSSFVLVTELIRMLGEADDRSQIAVGRIVSQLIVLRRLSRSVAWLLQSGAEPALQATIVKDLGAVFEQELPDVARALIDMDARHAGPNEFFSTLDYLVLASPAFSLRGGTREILRGIIARGLGLR